MPELSDPVAIAGTVERTLVEVEERLIRVIRDGSQGLTVLDGVIRNIDQVKRDLRSPHDELQDVLGRRDLTIDMVDRLEALRSRGLRLYRKACLEHVFFQKLQLERTVRDTLYRQVIQAFEEMGELDETERRIRALGDEALAADLSAADPDPPTDAP